MEFKYMEITIRLTLDLTCVVNGGRLVKPLYWLALQHGKVYCRGVGVGPAGPANAGPIFSY